MLKFLNENFFLNSETSRELYHDYASSMPVFDFHNHLNPADIADNRKFDNLTQIWLSGDHYKWRAMRTNGIDEKYCTGNAPDREKFFKWAQTVPFTIRNPLYHWSHLELKRYFSIDSLINNDTAENIYNRCSEMLKTEEYSVRKLLKNMNVKALCTTDDPADTLEHHIKIKNSGFEISVLPTFRIDNAASANNTGTYTDYISKLSECSNIEINSFEKFIDAVKERHDYFHSNGCRISDVSTDTFFNGEFTQNDISSIFQKLLNGKNVDEQDLLKYNTAVIYECCKMNSDRNWAQQIHIGAIRNNNSRAFKYLGNDTGFDSISDTPISHSLSNFLDRLEKENRLAKTILYNLNPASNEVIATMAGNFQDSSIPGKIQFGSGWWFLDQKDGIEKQINALSNLGLLSRFTGMLTDSRSFLSFPRHEYFRRILCDIVGMDVEKGLIPYDKNLTGRLIKDICFNNAVNYFGLELD